MPMDTPKEMERTPLSAPETLRVRCPHCRKLYLVQYADIQESKPRFECVSCHDRFWLSLADMDFSTEVEGLPIHIKDPVRPAPPSRIKDAVENDPCPKCFKLTPRGNPECVHCGVVIAKLKELNFKESVPAHSKNLEQLWHQVISNYDVAKNHDEFIRACQQEGNLPYAAALYGQMAKLMPMDDTTLARQGQIKALTQILMPEPTERPWNSGGRLWLIPLLAAAICIGVGMALPPFRNIAGVGAAFLFLAFAMRGR